jgi:uncharacterized protein (TIGR00369 family)
MGSNARRAGLSDRRHQIAAPARALQALARRTTINDSRVAYARSSQIDVGERMLKGQEIWQERPTGGLVDASLLTRPWREVLRLIHDGGAPQPPIAHLSGRRLIDLGEGQAALAMPATDWFLGPKGRLDSGVFTFLADMTHFYAVLSMLPVGAGCTTAELSMTFLGDPPYGGGEITSRSEVVYEDQRNALAVGLVCDNEGRPVAHSTSRYFLFPAGTSGPRPAEATFGEEETRQRPHPIFRSCGPTISPLDDHTPLSAGAASRSSRRSWRGNAYRLLWIVSPACG